MKKLIAFILVFAMLAALPLSLGSCGTPATGTEAAKLLLARQRMNENSVAQKIDFFSSPSSANTLRVNAPYEVYASLQQLNATAEKRADQLWTPDGFLKHSHSMVEFTQFMGGIEDSAVDAAEAIGKMKKDVGVTDLWVDFGWFYEYDYMLSVRESEDILFVRGDTQFRVYKRYTRQDAKSVYELYTYIQYDNGESGEIRELFIPGERYEYMFIPSAEDSGPDYFVADNSRGYWVATRYYVEEGRASFNPLIIKDGLGYGVFITVDGGVPQVAWYDVFDPINNRELLRVNIGRQYMTASLYITGIQSGLVSVGALESELYPYDGGYVQAHHLSEITTQKGTYFVQESADGVYLSDGYVQYLGYAGSYPATYYGSIDFTYDYPLADTVNVRANLEAFADYFEEIGLKTYCDMDKVAESLAHAAAFGDEFGAIFTWNDYYMDTIENMEAANRVLLNEFAEHRAMYEEIKDAPYASGSVYLSNSEFSRMDALVGGAPTYENGVVSLETLGATLSDATYLEIGKNYALRLGLSLVDANGNPISEFTVPLGNSRPEGITYDGTTLSVSLSGKFDLPKNLDSGRYAVVAYIATAEEGIRVTEMEKIAFLSIAEGKLDSAAMDITVEAANSHMFLVYAIKNNVRLNKIVDKDTHTYAEVKRFFTIAILERGYPKSDAVLEYEDGTPVSEDATLAKATYRMKAYLNTEDGIAESYIYITLT